MLGRDGDETSRVDVGLVGAVVGDAWSCWDPGELFESAAPADVEEPIECAISSPKPSAEEKDWRYCIDGFSETGARSGAGGGSGGMPRRARSWSTWRRSSLFSLMRACSLT